MKHILLIGKMGQVGQELQKTLVSLGKVTAMGHEELDLTQPEQIRMAIGQNQPDLVVNAAAYTAVDKAESEPELAWTINAEAPKVMAEEAQRLGAGLIHISTDYVFDGRQNTPYTETDATNPVSVYGRSKLAGEVEISQIYARSPELSYGILRTAWVYGCYGKGNFVKTMLRLGGDREEVRVVADQVGSPTWAAEIAGAIAVLSQNALDQVQQPESNLPIVNGLYHFTNSGVASWYDFAVAIFEEAQLLGFPLKLKTVVPITTAEYPTPAKRPAYSVLANQKISTLLKTPTAHWRQALRLMLTELHTELH